MIAALVVGDWEWCSVRVLVCGGAGFIGSTLTDRLIADGHTVAVVDNLSRGKRANLDSALASGRCELITLDITDPELTSAIKQAEPEVIVNLAAQIDVRHSVADPLHDASSNIMGTVAVLEAARQGGVRKVVLASSVAIYGPPAVLPVTEETPTNPLSPYAVSKLAGELYLRQYTRLHGLQTTTLVLTNTYGPRQDPHGEAGVIAIFADRMLSGEPTRVFGQGDNSRDYVFVDDVVDALTRACGPVADGQRLNIGTGVAVTDLELHRQMAAVAGAPAEPAFAPARLGDLPHMVVDSARARQALGWAPKVALAEGLARTFAWMLTPASGQSASTPA
jgi:UDP-glucose 4-epimerase